jgi:hypothetical protein
MSLDNFAKSCGVSNLSKTVYPYEKWLCPKDISNCKKFPPYSDFISSLTKKESPEGLQEFENIVNNRLRNGVWTNKT